MDLSAYKQLEGLKKKPEALGIPYWVEESLNYVTLELTANVLLTTYYTRQNVR